MTSRIVSFFKFFQRTNVGAVSAGPNSWATVGLWRRFFELKEQEEQEEQERIVEILEEIYQINSYRPVESEHAIKARREMVSEYYRGLRNNNHNNEGRNLSCRNNERIRDNSYGQRGEVGQQNHVQNNYASGGNNSSLSGWSGETRDANLDIPVGDFHVTLAQ